MKKFRKIRSLKRLLLWGIVIAVCFSVLFACGKNVTETANPKATQECPKKIEKIICGPSCPSWPWACNNCGGPAWFEDMLKDHGIDSVVNYFRGQGLSDEDALKFRMKLEKGLKQ